MAMLNFCCIQRFWMRTNIIIVCLAFQFIGSPTPTIVAEDVNDGLFGDGLLDLPEIPSNTEKYLPSVLFDLAALDESSKQWSINLVNDDSVTSRFVIKQIDHKKPRWIISDESTELKNTVAQVAIRGNDLLFVWHKTNSSKRHYQDLSQAIWNLESEDGLQYFMVAKSMDVRPAKNSNELEKKAIMARNLGYDPTHATPHDITHEYYVPGLEGYTGLFLEVRSPFLDSALMKLSDRKRRREFRRWIKVDTAVNQWLTVSLQWMAEHKKSKKQESEEPNLLVHQKITYEIRGAKNLPASNDQIRGHRNSLEQKIAEDIGRYNSYTGQLRSLKSRADSLRGAQRGTKEWSEQTVIGNQIRQGITRTKFTAKRAKNNKRTIMALKSIEFAVGSLLDHPIIYRIAAESAAGLESASLVQSKMWDVKSEDCMPLVGKWTNDESMHMEVTPEVITTKQDDGNMIVQNVYNVDSITACSTDVEDYDEFNRTNANVISCFFTDGKHTIMRREFTIDEADRDTAEETFYARVTNIWTPHTRKKIYKDGEVVTIDEGELKSWEIAKKYTWHRIAQ